VFGLGLGSAFLGLMSDWLARGHYAGDYRAECQSATIRPSGACAAASATGLQQAMLLLGLFLVFAILAFWLASRAISAEIASAER
jgi:hypothetical protein